MNIKRCWSCNRRFYVNSRRFLCVTCQHLYHERCGIGNNFSIKLVNLNFHEIQQIKHIVLNVIIQEEGLE